MIRSRSPSYARHGMVATSQTIASQVGVDILKSGGSAVDAAIAANAMLSLAEPYMCGPGGDLFAIVWDPSVGKLAGLNASGRSPQGMSYVAMCSAVGEANAIPGRGPLSISVPGAVDGWCALHERYGRSHSVKFSRLLSRTHAMVCQSPCAPPSTGRTRPGRSSTIPR
jgi:gamma-glutamyltranspeptidase/glutathione hydrolase